MQPAEARVLRPLQTSAPLHANAVDGSYRPLTATYPAVKPMSNDSGYAKKSIPDGGSNGAKRARVESGLLNNFAMNELLGKPSQSSASAQQRPATDFSVFNASLRAPSQGKAEGSTLVSAALATFQDIAMTSQHIRATEDKDVAAFKANFFSRSMPAENFSQHTQPVAAAPQPAQAAAEFRSHSYVPYDWALKKTVRVLSSQRLPCLGPAARVSSRHAILAQRGVQLGSWGQLLPEEKWQASLVSWRHPESPWEPEAVAVLSSSKGAARVLSQRLDAWRAAFASAYMAVRHGHSTALYVMMPEGTKHPCTIVFLGPGVHGSRVPCALVSTSTKLTRARMTQAGLDFTMPLAPKPKAEGGDQGAPSKAARTNTNATVRDGTPHSMLLLSGPQAVHMLFDYIMSDTKFEMPQAGVQSMDVPLLMAPVAFENAAMHCPQTKSMLVSSGTGSDGSESHAVEISGPVPPWTLTRMAAALAECTGAASSGSGSSGQAFQIEMSTPEHCLSLNVWDTSATGGIGGALDLGAGGGAMLVPGEADAAQAAPAELQHRVIRCVSYEPSKQAGGKGTFVMRTSG